MSTIFIIHALPFSYHFALLTPPTPLRPLLPLSISPRLPAASGPPPLLELRRMCIHLLLSCNFIVEY